MSSLRRGHANLLCIVPILSDGTLYRGHNYTIEQMRLLKRCNVEYLGFISPLVLWSQFNDSCKPFILRCNSGNPFALWSHSLLPTTWLTNGICQDAHNESTFRLLLKIAVWVIQKYEIEFLGALPNKWPAFHCKPFQFRCWWTDNSGYHWLNIQYIHYIGNDTCKSILAGGAISLRMTPSGCMIIASWKLLQFPSCGACLAGNFYRLCANKLCFCNRWQSRGRRFL